MGDDQFISSAGSSADAEEHLVALGCADGHKAWQSIRLLVEEGFIEGPEALLPLLASTPDPDQALTNLERFSKAVPDTGPLSPLKLRLVVPLFGYSRFLSSFLIRFLYRLDAIVASGYLFTEKTRQIMEQEITSGLKAEASLDEFMAHLRQCKYGELLRIAIRDLAGLAPLVEICRELSSLAGACLEVTLKFCLGKLTSQYGQPWYLAADGHMRPCEFVVLGLGKLGGEELNFSSDIDLLYIYTSDRGETQGQERDGQMVNRISLHQYFVKLCEMMNKVLSAVTPEGFGYRVDLRLRPEGTRGDLANSLRSAEIYYESWGQSWERLALLKAWPVAGSRDLGNQFLKIVEPFVYRKYLDFTAIEEVKELKWRMEAALRAQGSLQADVKLGPGGIREIEFFVQALQVVYGGKGLVLRERNTLKGLERLAQAGLITEKEREALADAYLFMRKVEHLIQMVDERQWHSLPRDARDRMRLARALGLASWPEFMARLEEKRRVVAAAYQGLFSSRESVPEEEKLPETAALFAEGMPELELQQKLAALGFADPHRAGQVVALLREGPPFTHLSFKARRMLKRIAPGLLAEIAACPDPDMALINLESFVSRLGVRGAFYSLLAENPAALKILVGLFGTSQFLSRLLISHPDLLDILVSEESFLPAEVRDLDRELMETLAPMRTLEDKLDGARRFKNIELLKIGMRDIYGQVDPFTTMYHLSQLADASIRAALAMAWEEMLIRYPMPPTLKMGEEFSGPKLAIIGLGKLGGQELSYGSDLDLIFIYTPGGSLWAGYLSPQEFFPRLAVRVISALSLQTREGFLFRVDTRLRPSGRAGTLVSSLESFTRYHKESSRLWERQALTKARVVAGEPQLGQQIMALVQDFVYGRPAPESYETEMHRLRMRMEKELVREESGKYNIKVGRGGIVDIEFLVQLLQLRHGQAYPQVRCATTVKALEELREAGLLASQDYGQLKGAYQFLRRLENSIRIVNDLAVDELSLQGSELERLARRMGYASGQALAEEYQHQASEVRNIYQRFFSQQGG